MGIFALVFASIMALVALMVFFYARKELTVQIVGAEYAPHLRRGKGVELFVRGEEGSLIARIVRCVWIGNKVYFHRLVDVNPNGQPKWETDGMFEVAVQQVKIGVAIDLDTMRRSGEAQYMFDMWELEDRCAEEAKAIAKKAMATEDTDYLFERYKAAFKKANIRRWA